MAMTAETAEDRRVIGLREVNGRVPAYERRQRYFDGDHDLPYAPQGVSVEYMELRRMAIANWLEIAVRAPVQRLRVDGFRTSAGDDEDRALWGEVWQANNLDARQRTVYTAAAVHGRGFVSVWSGAGGGVQVRPEDGRGIHIEPREDDPYASDWAVKSYVTQSVRQSTGRVNKLHVCIVYDADEWVRFEKLGATSHGGWSITDGGANPVGAVPFVAFDLEQDANGRPGAGITRLIPAQDALNSIRFYTLLAMQFGAFRQRVFTGYDPVRRDAAGEPLFVVDQAGTPVLDHLGLPIPQMNTPGRVGVDRALVFPGADTRVFDLPESNLSNYIDVLGEFLTQFFAIAQVPPQYLLSRMANLSGDALAGAESTLAALVSDMQSACAESWEMVMRLAARALGSDVDDVSSEVVWGDAEARSFAQVADAITKLVTIKFPRQAAFELLPGATPQKVERWMGMVEDEMASQLDALFREPPGAV